jgi:hypothetical protein
MIPFDRMLLSIPVLYRVYAQARKILPRFYVARSISASVLKRMDMLRYDNKPPRRREQKPVTKAMAQQRRTEALNGHARMAFTVFYSLAAVVIVVGMAGKMPMAAATPQVGDVLHISTAARAPGALLATVQARLVTGPWAHPGLACTLDESVMAVPGGTLTVLARRSDGVMLSWAGGATANTASCPAPSQVLVSPSDYRALTQISVARRPFMAR